MSIFLKEFHESWRYSENPEVSFYEILTENENAFFNLEKDFFKLKKSFILNESSILNEDFKSTIKEWWQKFINMLKFAWKKVSEWWKRFLGIFKKESDKAKKESKPASEYSTEKLDCSVNLDISSFKNLANYDLEEYVKDFGTSEEKTYLVDFSLENMMVSIQNKDNEALIGRINKAKEILGKSRIFSPEEIKANIYKKFHYNERKTKFSKLDAHNLILASTEIINRLSAKDKEIENHYNKLIKLCEAEQKGEKTGSISFGPEVAKAEVSFYYKAIDIEKTIAAHSFMASKLIFSFAKGFRG